MVFSKKKNNYFRKKPKIMSALDSFLVKNFPEFPSLNQNIDQFPDLKQFQKLKNRLELPKLIELFVEDLTKNPRDLLPYLYYLKSFIAIFGLQFIFLLLKIPTFLSTLQINANARSENKEIPNAYFEIMVMITEKTKRLRGSPFNIEEVRPLMSMKLPSNYSANLPVHAKNSEFDQIYEESLLFQKEIQKLLIHQGDKPPQILTDYAMRLDQLNSKIVALTKISKSENALIREITKTNNNLIEELKKSQETSSVSVQKKEPLAKRTFFHLFESLPLENMEIEYKNYYCPFANEQFGRLEMCICAFLNANGGRIFLGVKDDGNTVVGMKLNSPYKFQELREEIKAIVDGLNPPLNPNQWKIIFLPIFNEWGFVKNQLFVVKILIRRGEEKFVYSTRDNKFYKRRDGKVKMLMPEEIKVELMKRKENTISIDNGDDFNDPEPDESMLNDFGNYNNKEPFYNNNYNLNNFQDQKNKNFGKKKENDENMYYNYENYQPYNVNNEWWHPNNQQEQKPYQKNNKKPHNYDNMYEKVYVPKQIDSIKPFEQPSNSKPKENQEKLPQIPEKTTPNPTVLAKKPSEKEMLNTKVLCLEILGDNFDKSLLMEIFQTVKKQLMEFLNLKFVKAARRINKKMIFCEFNEDLYDNKDMIFEMVNAIFNQNYQQKFQLSLNVRFGDKKKYAKYEKEYILIK